LFAHLHYFLWAILRIRGFSGQQSPRVDAGAAKLNPESGSEATLGIKKGK